MIVLVLMLLKAKLGIISTFFQSGSFICIMIYLVSQEKKDELISSQENLKNIKI